MTEEKWLVNGPKVIDTGAIQRLKVGLVGGQVDIVGHDEPGARVEVHSVSGKDLKVTLTDGVLEIDHPQLGWENWLDVFTAFRGTARADVSVMVPRHIALTFGVVSASGLISGLQTDATLSTVSGDLVVDQVTGDLELNAVSGELSVRAHDGDIVVRTVSGDVTASGEIGRFTSDGVSGKVYLDLSGTPDRVRVNTVSGDVAARLAGGVPASYRINTVSGTLQLDDERITGIRGSYSSRVGDLSEHFLDFSANTVSGNVSVLHSVDA